MWKCSAVAIILATVVGAAAQVAFNPEQQKQFAKCTVAAQKVQEEVGNLFRLANGPEFSAEKAKQQAAKVRDSYMVMHEQHKALMEPLAGDQAKAVEARKTRMDQACTRIRASLKELELAAALPNPDAKSLAKHAQAIESAMNEWQKEHHAIGREMRAVAR
jgi:hypothetical protein